MHPFKILACVDILREGKRELDLKYRTRMPVNQLPRGFVAMKCFELFKKRSGEDHRMTFPAFIRTQGDRCVRLAPFVSESVDDFVGFDAAAFVDALLKRD